MLARTAAVFAPKVAARRAAGRASAVAVRASAGRDFMERLPGVSAPLGFWDPLGFTSSPTFTVSEAKRFREAEVTHGRVSMLAAVGWLVAEEFHPFFGGEIGGPAFRHFQARGQRSAAAACESARQGGQRVTARGSRERSAVPPLRLVARPRRAPQRAGS